MDTDGLSTGATPIDYLRISVTDRCNLRCIYCMPAEGVHGLDHDDIMTYEELDLFARAAVGAGITRIRLTGGEPMVRKGLTGFIEMLSRIEPAPRLSLTTNGVLLAGRAAELKRAGLDRVNVSIDSLDPEVYRHMTRIGDLDGAMAGVRDAVEQGLDPVKLNVVVLKGVNDDPTAFGELTRELPVHVRFIEFMPYFDRKDRSYVPGHVIRERLGGLGPLEEAESPEGWGPAEYFRLRGAAGTLGTISSVSCHFCPSCNRLRVTADGHMRTCLFDSDGVDVKAAIRAGADPDRLREIIDGELERKRAEGDSRKPGPGSSHRATDHMSRIGG
ncbi:MAG: GTP 3',8-cyclase MoaA [Actinomycetota bacterium]